MRSTLAAALAFALLGISAAAPSRAAGEGPKLRFPLACQIGQSCEVQNYVDRQAGPGWQDYHCGHRTYDGHTGVDIRVLDLPMQRKGVNVLAAAPGRVLRLRDGVPDVLLKDMNQPHDSRIGCGNAVVLDHGDGWTSVYCHMAKGSVRVKVGQAVAAGEPLGQVGVSGDTQFPHLHIEVRHDGQVVDPFAPAPLQPGVCAAKDAMWDAAAARALAYKRGAILNAGLASGPVSEDSIEEGGIAPATSEAEVITAYARPIALETGDVIGLVFTMPGRAPTEAKLPPLKNNSAQQFMALSRKRPEGGWPHGRYVAAFTVWRAGKPALQRTVEAKL
jgi:hypothetical protein